MADTTAREVASGLIALSRERGAGITNLKLQKLLYYSQAWWLAFNKVRLFEDKIEAWVHGPVVAKVFGDYKLYRWSNIESATMNPPSDSEICNHIVKVWDAYGHLGATDLERLTHSEKPWQEARRGLSPDEPSREEIKVETMREFYTSLLHGART